MIERRLFLRLVVMVLLLVPSCMAPDAPAPTVTPAPIETPAPSPTPPFNPLSVATASSQADTYPYGKTGPYPVGVAIVSLPQGDAALVTYVWAPIQSNGQPDTKNGPFPLVVFSPGLNTPVYWSHLLLENLASQGFVIIGANPRDFTEDGDEFWYGAATRILDMKLHLAYAEEMTAPGGDWAGLIDMDKIAVMGMSSGGWTALIGGGAQMDLGWCTAHPDLAKKLIYSNCPQFVPHQQDIAAMLGLESAPDGLWPAMNDPRVDAVAALVPDGDLWGPDYGGLAVMNVPALIMTGTADSINLPELCAYPMYEHIGSPRKTMVVINDVDHLFYLGELPSAVYTINNFVSAFLLAELKDDPEAAKVLSSANNTLPGVKIQSTLNSKE